MKEKRKERFSAPVNKISREHKTMLNAVDQVEYWDSYARLIMETIESRHAQKVSQQALAQLMGTKQSVISRFENMGRLPSYDFIARLSMALGHSPGMTLYGEQMAVVPEAKHGLIKQLSEREGIPIQALVERIFERGMALCQPREITRAEFAKASQNVSESAGSRTGDAGRTQEWPVDGTDRSDFAKAG
jgi:transcriptional regulator with XRE-family HTH domain